MFELNLLPPEKRMETRLLKIARVMFAGAIGFFSVILIASFLLLPSWFYLRAEKIKIAEQFSQEKSNSTEKEKILRASLISRRAEKADKFSFNGDKVAGLFRFFLDSSDIGISVSYMQISRGGRISLGGTANSEENMAKLETSLKSSGWFAEIEPSLKVVSGSAFPFIIRGRLNSFFAF